MSDKPKIVDVPSVGFVRGPLKEVPVSERGKYKRFDVATGEEIPIDWKEEEKRTDDFPVNKYVEVNK